MSLFPSFLTLESPWSTSGRHHCLRKQVLTSCDSYHSRAVGEKHGWRGMKALKNFPSHWELWRGWLVLYLFGFFRNRLKITTETTSECQETLTKMTVVSCSAKNRCLLKCQPITYVSLTLRAAHQSCNVEKAIIMKNGHSSLLNDSWHPYQNGNSCCSPSSVEVVGISVAQDSDLFPVFRSIGQTSYLEIDIGYFIVLTFLFSQWIALKVIDLSRVE